MCSGTPGEMFFPYIFTQLYLYHWGVHNNHVNYDYLPKRIITSLTKEIFPWQGKCTRKKAISCVWNIYIKSCLHEECNGPRMKYLQWNGCSIVAFFTGNKGLEDFPSSVPFLLLSFTLLYISLKPKYRITKKIPQIHCRIGEQSLLHCIYFFNNPTHTHRKLQRRNFDATYIG